MEILNMSGETARILHVDDEPDFGKLVKAFIEREDEAFKVVTETCVSDEPKRLQSDGIDCVISDYEMPANPPKAYLPDGVNSTWKDLSHAPSIP